MTLKSTKKIDRKAKSLYRTFLKFGINLTMDELRSMITAMAMCCPYCDDTLKTKDISVDHIIPRSRGGSDNMNNLHLVHKSCNLLKGNFMEEEFARIRKFIAGNPDIAVEISRRLRSSGFMYRR